jgi:copper chaperone CopZ
VNAYHARVRPAARPLIVGLLAVAGMALASCGSSKPAYCDHVSKLKGSVSGISITGGVSGLKTQLDQIAGNAKSVVSSAKSDFPDETSAVNSSIDKLQTDLKGIPSSPSASQLAAAASAVKGVVTSVDSFVSATKSKCQ